MLYKHRWHGTLNSGSNQHSCRLICVAYLLLSNNKSAVDCLCSILFIMDLWLMLLICSSMISSFFFLSGSSHIYLLPLYSYVIFQLLAIFVLFIKWFGSEWSPNQLFINYSTVPNRYSMLYQAFMFQRSINFGLHTTVSWWLCNNIYVFLLFIFSVLFELAILLHSIHSPSFLESTLLYPTLWIRVHPTATVSRTYPHTKPPPPHHFLFHTYFFKFLSIILDRKHTLMGTKQKHMRNNPLPWPPR